MKNLPHYDRIECAYDLDHEINEVVKETKETMAELKEMAETRGDYNAIAKAMIATILDTL